MIFFNRFCQYSPLPTTLSVSNKISMKKKSILKIAYLLIVGLLIGAGLGIYLFNMPDRDIAGSESDFSLMADALVNEYLENSQIANAKYLDDEGESSIITISGELANISEDFNGQIVLLLKSPSAKAGVSATLSKESLEKISDFNKGQDYRIKGVIRSGASYDEDLEMFENVILEKCEIIN
jgi:hypothetical protein